MCGEKLAGRPAASYCPDCTSSHPEEGGSKVLRNARILSQHSMASRLQ